MASDEPSLNSTRLSLAIAHLPLTPFGMISPFPRSQESNYDNEREFSVGTSEYSRKNTYGHHKASTNLTDKLDNKSSPVHFNFVNTRRRKLKAGNAIHRLQTKSPQFNRGRKDSCINESSEEVINIRPVRSIPRKFFSNNHKAESFYTDIDDGSFVEFLDTDVPYIRDDNQPYYSCLSQNDSEFSTSTKLPKAEVGLHGYIDKIMDQKYLNMITEEPETSESSILFSAPQHNLPNKNKHCRINTDFPVDDSIIVPGSNFRMPVNKKLVMNSTLINGAVSAPISNNMPDISSLMLDEFSNPNSLNNSSEESSLSPAINVVLHSKNLYPKGIFNGQLNNKEGRLLIHTDTALSEDISILSSDNAQALQQKNHYHEIINHDLLKNAKIPKCPVETRTDNVTTSPSCSKNRVMSWIATSPFKDGSYGTSFLDDLDVMQHHVAVEEQEDDKLCNTKMGLANILSSQNLELRLSYEPSSGSDLYPNPTGSVITVGKIAQSPSSESGIRQGSFNLNLCKKSGAILTKDNNNDSYHCSFLSDKNGKGFPAKDGRVNTEENNCFLLAADEGKTIPSKDTNIRRSFSNPDLKTLDRQFRTRIEKLLQSYDKVKSNSTCNISPKYGCSVYGSPKLTAMLINNSSEIFKSNSNPMTKIENKDTVFCNNNDSAAKHNLLYNSNFASVTPDRYGSVNSITVESPIQHSKRGNDMSKNKPLIISDSDDDVDNSVRKCAIKRSENSFAEVNKNLSYEESCAAGIVVINESSSESSSSETKYTMRHSKIKETDLNKFKGCVPDSPLSDNLNSPFKKKLEIPVFILSSDSENDENAVLFNKSSYADKMARLSVEESRRTPVKEGLKNSEINCRHNANKKKVLDSLPKLHLTSDSSTDDSNLSSYMNEWKKKKNFKVKHREELKHSDSSFLDDDESSDDMSFYLSQQKKNNGSTKKPLVDNKTWRDSPPVTLISSSDSDDFCRKIFKPKSVKVSKVKPRIPRHNIYNTKELESDGSDSDCHEITKSRTSIKPKKFIQMPLVTKHHQRDDQKTPVTSQKLLSFLASLALETPVRNAHPDAVLAIKNFKAEKDSLAVKLYKYYNTYVFDKKLPATMKITWNVRMIKTAGFCFFQVDRTSPLGRGARIELSVKVIDGPGRLRDTLIHELCHAAAWIISGYKGGHGPVWKAWAAKATGTFPELPKISRCHSYNIQYKYTYRCVKCGQSIGRHSKSLDTEKKVCGKCFGKFELIVSGNKKPANSAAGVPSTPRTLNPFALFVKENYSTVKKSSGVCKHGDVMKALSEKFNRLKTTGFRE